MNILAIVGSHRKGKASDILVDRAIEGAKSKDLNCNVRKINLIEHRGVEHYVDKAFELGKKLV
jgi:multimeric flavodoxin WrbA